MKHNKLLLWEHLRVWLTTGTIITVQYSSGMLLTIPVKRMNLIRLSNSTFGTSIDQNANVTLPRFKVSSTESDLLAGRVFAFKSISRFPQMTAQCSIQCKCRFEISAQDINGWIMEVVRFSTLHIFTWYRSRYLTLPVHSSYDLLRLFTSPEIAEGLIIFIRWKDTFLSSCSCTRIVTGTPASRRATDKDIWQYLDWSHVGGAVQRAKVRRRFTLIVFLRGALPSVTHSPSRRRLRDVNPWPWPLGRCRPEFQAAGSGCLLLCYLCSEWTQRKRKRNGNIVTRSAETKVLLARIILWALTHNCKGLWEIGTFHCFCSNHLFICLPFSPSCPHSPFCLSSLSSPICSFFSRSPLSSSSPLRPRHPSLPILIISHFDFSLRVPLFFPPSVSLTSSSSQSSLASYLNCPACRRTQSRRTPRRLYCQHQFLL